MALVSSGCVAIIDVGSSLGLRLPEVAKQF
jgi:hypothetical protein